MEFSWTTFTFEVINFLALVWILQHFLYRPVTAAIARRKTAIETEIAAAKTKEAEALQLKSQFENRLADWEKEKSAAREQWLLDLAAEKKRGLAELDESLQQERKKSQVLEQRRIVELTERMADEANANAIRFANRLLSRLAGPALENKIRDVLIEDLGMLSGPERDAFISACNTPDAKILVATAFPLDAGGHGALVTALSALAGKPLAPACESIQDNSLICGFRLTAGPWILKCNIADELEFFQRHHSYTGVTI